MTLNLTVLTKDRIYQSADFRVTSRLTGQVRDDRTMKIVSVHYAQFDGFVTFTGMESWEANETQYTLDHLESWLSSTGPDIAFHEMVELIRAKGTELVQSVAQSEGATPRLIFIAGAFSEERSVIAVVSNGSSQPSDPVAELRTQWHKLPTTDSAYLLVTGYSPALSTEDRKDLLKTIAADPHDPMRIRVALTTANRQAARSTAANNTISEECTVISMDKFGTTRQDFSGPGTPGVVIRTIVNGENTGLQRMLEDLGLLTGGAIVDFSFGSSKASDAPAEVHVCERVLDNPSASTYELIEVTSSDACGVFAVNAERWVVGYQRAASSPWHQHYWLWTPEQGLQALRVAGSETSAAINDQGLIALVALDTDNRHRPAIWANGEFTILEMGDDTNEPRVSWISSSGYVGGHLSTDTGSRQEDRVKPAVWRPDGSVLIMMNTPDSDAGRVVSINDAGTALVWGSLGLFGATTIVWDTTTNSAHRLPGNNIPVHISDTGAIVAIETTPAGEHRPTMCLDGTTWTPCEVNDGFGPITANDALTIAGNVLIDGYMTGWTKGTGQNVTLLPKYANHACRVSSISSNENIVGTFEVDNYRHVVLWQPQ